MIAVAGGGGGSGNLALASAGAVASASSTYAPGFPVSALNNNERAGAGWGSGGGWADGTPGTFPDWVQIAFNGSKTINRVVLYTLQDNYSQPVEPNDSLTFVNNGITDFTVEGWTGSAWTQLASVSNNNLVKRTVAFAPFTTDRLRINVTAARSPWALITEIEAWGSGGTSSPPPNPTPGSDGAAVVVRMTDAPVFPGDSDGPTWEYANRQLYASWAHPGGDWRDIANTPQGNAHYAASPDIVFPGDVALPVTALVARLLTNNTGIYANMTKGQIKLASRTNSAPGPRLHIVTTTGIFDPPCVVDTWLSASTNQPLGGQQTLEFPAILKFDLTGVTGTVTGATLTLNVSNVYAAPAQVAVNYLDPPSLNLTATGAVVGNRIEGIAATVAQDKALASHPSVLLYDDLVSKDYIRNNFQGVAGEGFGQGPPNLTNNADIIQWPQFGLSAARVWSITTNQRVISWHHWAEPKQNPPKSWQRDFGNGHTHLFFRYLMEIGTDVKSGMTEIGFKLPGMAGTYDFSNSGAVTLPQPRGDGTWEMRLSQVGLSPRAHPDIYHIGTYYYGVEHPLSQFSGNGDWRLTNGYVKAGRIYSIEQEIKLNTLTNGVANADGIERVWIDGVLMYENTATRIRGYDNVRIQSIPWMNIYHGGLLYPSAPFHYDLGGIVVATEYIGPPKLLQ